MMRNRKRNGAAIFDVVVAAALVLATLAIVTPLVIGSAQTWKQTRNVQVACDELTAKMDRLVTMPSEERTSALANLEISEFTKRQLVEPTLDGKIIDDRDGKRIQLSINWRRRSDPPPLTLVAWIRPVEMETNEAGETP